MRSGWEERPHAHTHTGTAKIETHSQNAAYVRSCREIEDVPNIARRPAHEEFTRALNATSAMAARHERRRHRLSFGRWEALGQWQVRRQASSRPRPKTQARSVKAWGSACGMPFRPPTVAQKGNNG